MSLLTTQAATSRRSRRKPKRTKIKLPIWFIDLENTLQQTLTKAEMKKLAALLKPAGIKVSGVKEGRRWRARLACPVGCAQA